MLRRDRLIPFQNFGPDFLQHRSIEADILRFGREAFVFVILPLARDAVREMRVRVSTVQFYHIEARGSFVRDINSVAIVFELDEYARGMLGIDRYRLRECGIERDVHAAIRERTFAIIVKINIGRFFGEEFYFRSIGKLYGRRFVCRPCC